MVKHRLHTQMGQHLALLPERAVFWQETRTLIVADVHLGKGHLFRRSGIPVPGGTTAGDLSRLSHLIERHQPQTVLFLGDLVHGRIDTVDAYRRLIDRWRHRHKRVHLLLVTGNHDAHARRLPDEFGFDRVSAHIMIDPFCFTHQPTVPASVYGMAGHRHPAVTVTGKGRLKETLPCFCFGPRAAVLPAFGGLTGSQRIHPTPKDHVYVIADDHVLKV